MPDVFVSKPTTEETQRKGENVLAHHEKGKPFPPFAMYCEYPQGVLFEHQEDNEQIILLIRRHIIKNLGWISMTIILTLLPFLFGITFAILPLPFVLPASYIVIVVLFYYLIILGAAFTQFVTWFYHVGIVTNFRVVDVDIHSIMSRNVASTEIGGLVDVEYAQKGFLSSFFDYGDVHMQTEGLKPNFEFLAVPHPARVSDTINDLKRSLNK